MEDSRRSLLTESNKQRAHDMRSQRVKQQAQGLHGSTPDPYKHIYAYYFYGTPGCVN